MEIGRVRSSTITKTGEEKKIVSGRKSFSRSFDQAKERKSQEQLDKMAEDIKKKGNRLVITKTYADVKIYKKLIKEYLQSVLDYMYNTKKDISFWQTQYFITVDTVDEKLEELTKAIVEDQMENINIASTIDEIQGLIVDIYR
ncbi:YaaR family protein [Clostridium sp. HCP1S3_B4]|uniref:YaaR family protein n=1 Tax=unclassified Clostridium TaxID=2614128 RepID=UPI0016917AEA|nr:YaaR family protein [Clostridiales bacterium]MDY2729302.1 YaaR family protein [Clostridium sp.]NLK23040.1 YaaR family protein [Clostridiales bacterium]